MTSGERRDRVGRSRRSTVLCAALLVIVCSSACGENALWCAAWITDTQTPAGEWIDALLARVAADHPVLVLHTGDTRFEWANRCAWRAVRGLFLSETPAREFHLAPGNHDLTNGVLKLHLRRAAARGLYRLDTGLKAAGYGYYHNRVPHTDSGPLWPIWNQEVLTHPAWQVTASKKPADWRKPEIPYRYVFKRGGIRFIIGDCFPTEDQTAWIRKLITDEDDSTLSILLQHKHEVDALAASFTGLEGRHNVKLVLTGDHHRYCHEKRHDVTFVTGAGVAKGPGGENDAMTLRVYPDRLQLDRYVIPKDARQPVVQGPFTIWTAAGRFLPYSLPETTPQPAVTASSDQTRPTGRPTPTVGPNLLHNNDFDNHVWYERYRGWSPSYWYQWFTRGGHAPEHAVGKYPSPPHPAHTGKEYVRIHMWAHAWRGGILQTVRGVEPCRYYRLTAHGFFQPEGTIANARIGINPRGTLADQFSVDVSKHPAPRYDEGVGDDLKTPGNDGSDIAEHTVWSAKHNYHRWGTFEVTAEARSDTIMAILYCAPDQRPAEKPIYEMNWDSVSLREIPWPDPRLVAAKALLKPDKRRIRDARITVQAAARTGQITWGTTIPAGAAQVLYRFLDAEAVNKQQEGADLRSADFPFNSPVYYERSAKRHWVSLTDLRAPDHAVELQALALARVCEEHTCRTLSSALLRHKLR